MRVGPRSGDLFAILLLSTCVVLRTIRACFLSISIRAPAPPTRLTSHAGADWIKRHFC